ncbi:MAG: PEGA domain-containing protein [Terriglobales bacterium]
MLRRCPRAFLFALALTFAPAWSSAQVDAAQEARDLLAKVMEEGGGEAAVKSIQGWRYKAVQTHRDTTGEHINQVDVLVLLPDRVHIASRNPQGSVTVVYSPAEAFWVSETQSGNFPAFDHQALLRDLKTNPINVLQHASEGGYSFRVAGSEVVAGVSVRILQVLVPGAQANWYVDPASGRVLKTSQFVATASGSAERIREYSDWRWVGESVFPFRQLYAQKGTGAAIEGSIEIRSIQINPPTDVRLFTRSPLSLSSVAYTPAAVTFTPPPPPPPKTAALRISAQPGRAQVYLDDEPKGIASEEGRLVLKELTPGTYRLRLTLADYKDWSQSITLQPGDELTVEARLLPRGPAPFTDQDIVDMLEGGVSPKRAATLVRQQGVDFTLTDAIERKLRAAGGDDDLLLAIAKSKK